MLRPHIPVSGLPWPWKSEHDLSIAEIERALALNPDYVDWRFDLVLVVGGHSRRAMDMLYLFVRRDVSTRNDASTNSAAANAQAQYAESHLIREKRLAAEARPGSTLG